MAEINRLQELRLAASEARIDARLALGSDSEVVPELERLVAEQPFREHLRGQLMLALYRADRQADALAAYRAARAALDEELGVEPGAALQTLQIAILQQDPALDLPRRPGSAVATSLPGAPAAGTPVRRRELRPPALVAMLALVVAIGLMTALVSQQRSTAPPSTAAGSPLPTPTIGGPESTASRQEAALLKAVPTVLRPFCLRTEPGQGASTNVVSLHCPPGPGSEADDTWFESFEALQTLNSAFDQLVPDGVANGKCSETRTNVVGPWEAGSTFSGYRLCFKRDGRSWIVWTYTDRRILARAVRTGDDAEAVAALYNWWYDVAVELR